MSDEPHQEANKDAGLAELLGARALRASPARLSVDIVIGTLVIAVAAWTRPASWLLLVSAGACLCAYGAWAFATRRLHAESWRLSPATEQRWRVLHAAAAFIGLAAFVLLLLSLLGMMLGTWIS